MRRWVGRALVLTGVVHCAAGFVIFGDVLLPILREGVFNTLRPETYVARGGAFWFFFTGFLVLIFGGLVDEVERRRIEFPAFLPWSLLAFSIAGCVMMPASGFWLLLVPVVGMFAQRRRGALQPSAPDDGRGIAT